MAGVAGAIGSFFVSGASSSASGIFDPPSRAVGYAANALCPNRWPDPANIIQAYKAGLLTQQTADIALRAQGVLTELYPDIPAGMGTSDAGVRGAQRLQAAWAACNRLVTNTPSPADIDESLFRKNITADQWRQYMQMTGTVEELWLGMAWENRFNLPSPDLAIRATVNQLTDKDFARRWALDTGFSPYIGYWLDSAGWGGSAWPQGTVPDGQDDVTWSTVLYRDRWRLLDIGTATELYFRLRPGREKRYEDLVPGVLPFTLDDLNAVYNREGIAPGLQDYQRLAAYKTMGIRQLQQAYAANVINRAEVKDQLLDQGWNPTDAEVRTKVIENNVYRQETSKLNINPKPSILEGYEQRLLTKGQAASRLWQWMNWGTPYGDTLLAMPQAQLEQVALAVPSINAALYQVDLDWQLAWTKRALARWKRRYQHGMKPKDIVQGALRNFGIAADRVNAIIDEWTDEMASGKLLASTSMIRRWVLKQTIPIQTAIEWLTNLGWQQPEIQAITLELQQDFAMEQAKAMEKLAKTQGQAEAALARQIRAANKAANEAQQKLLRTMSPNKAHRYFVRGIIGLPALTTVLGNFDYQGVPLNAAIKDAEIDRAKYLAEQAKSKSAKQPAGTNGKKA